MFKLFEGSIWLVKVWLTRVFERLKLREKVHIAILCAVQPNNVSQAVIMGQMESNTPYITI